MEQELTFHDISDASEFSPLNGIPWWLLMVFLGTLLILIVLTRLLHSRKNSVSPQKNPYQEALKRVNEQKSQLTSSPLTQVAETLSLTLREAIYKSTGSPLLYQSQQEFLSSASLPIRKSALAQKTVDHLNLLWSLEYADPTSDESLAHRIISESTALLSELKAQHSS